MASGNELNWYLSINCVRFQVLIVSGTGRCRESGTNGIGDGFISVIETPHGDFMLAGFAKFQRAEAV